MCHVSLSPPRGPGLAWAAAGRRRLAAGGWRGARGAGSPRSPGRRGLRRPAPLTSTTFPLAAPICHAPYKLLSHIIFPC